MGVFSILDLDIRYFNDETLEEPFYTPAIPRQSSRLTRSAATSSIEAFFDQISALNSGFLGKYTCRRRGNNFHWIYDPMCMWTSASHVPENFREK